MDIQVDDVLREAGLVRDWSIQRLSATGDLRSLRSPAWFPRVLAVKLYERKPEDFSEAVATICMTRSKGRSTVEPKNSVFDGIVFAIRPFDSLYDRLAEQWSHGYFDENDLPPWDTWIAYFTRFDALLSYVPASLVQSLNAGIEAMPFRRVFRASNRPELADLLQRCA